MARRTDDEVEALLTAAMGARADLVREEDLGRRPGPAAVRTLPTRATGRRWAPLVAAAAVGGVVALALSVPSLLGQSGEGPGPAGTPTVVDPGPAPDGWVGGVGEGGEGADLTDGAWFEADLDGDGADDEVRVRTGPAYEGRGPVRVEAELSSDPQGTVRWTLLRSPAVNAYPTGPGNAMQLDGDPGQELVLAVEADRSGDVLLTAVDLVGDRLVEAEPPVAGEANTAPFGVVGTVDGAATAWFVTGDGATTELLTGRTVGEPAWEARFRRYDVWSWRVLAPAGPGDRPTLTAEPAGQRCVDAETGLVAACREGSDRPVTD